MTTDDLDAGLLGIALSDSEDSDTGSSSSPKECSKPAAPTSREERNAQSEVDFQKLKAEYRVKVENGELWKSISLPLRESASKPAAQEIVHAAEELYFFRRYEEAVAFIRRVMAGGGEAQDGEVGFLDRDSRDLMRYYEGRCLERLSARR